jgi:hypothetical protein
MAGSRNSHQRKVMETAIEGAIERVLQKFGVSGEMNANDAAVERSRSPTKIPRTLDKFWRNPFVAIFFLCWPR